MILRMMDILLSVVGLLVTWPFLTVLLFIGFFDTGSPIFRQVRVGRNQQPFTLFKLRTMRLDTQAVATHIVNPLCVTKLGRFLRKTKLDELPQLWNVLKGEMSLVGPRPCLFNQQELIDERALRGVFATRPGITGLAQIQGIDMSTPKLLAKTDSLMIQDLNLYLYFSYILKTVTGAGLGDRIRKE